MGSADSQTHTQLVWEWLSLVPQWFTIWFGLLSGLHLTLLLVKELHVHEFVILLDPAFIQQEWRSSQTQRPQVHNPMMHCKLQQIDRNKTCCKVHNPFLVHFVSLISAHSTALIKYQQNHKYCETLRVYERKREGRGERAWTYFWTNHCSETSLGQSSLFGCLINLLFRDFSWSIFKVWVLHLSPQIATKNLGILLYQVYDQETKVHDQVAQDSSLPLSTSKLLSE